MTACIGSSNRDALGRGRTVDTVSDAPHKLTKSELIEIIARHSCHAKSIIGYRPPNPKPYTLNP